MGWLVILAAAATAIMIYTEARLRLVLLGLLLLATAVAVFFLYYLEQITGATGAGPPPAPETVVQRQRIGQARAAIRADEIGLSGLRLEPRTESYLKADGSKATRSNLRVWTFAVTVNNENPAFHAETIAFTIQLYSCPDYFPTPQPDVDQTELRQYCTRIGDRRLAFYSLDLAPGAATDLNSEITFDNQVEPGNWRYLVQVTDIVAKVAN